MTDVHKAAEALKPCPFCGAEAHQHYDFVSCSSCGISTATSTAERSAAEWNLRAALAADKVLEDGRVRVADVLAVDNRLAIDIAVVVCRDQDGALRITVGGPGLGSGPGTISFYLPQMSGPHTMPVEDDSILPHLQRPATAKESKDA